MTDLAHHDDDRLLVEPDEVPRRRLLVIGAVVTVVGTIGVLVARALLLAGIPASPPAPAEATPQIGIVEQTLIRSTRRGLDEREAHRKSLDRFAWVDRAHGIAQIPIDDAMDLVADPAFLQKVERGTGQSAALDHQPVPGRGGGP